MTDQQAKSLALDSVYRSVDAAASFVLERISQELRTVVYAHVEFVEGMIDGWLSDTGFGRNFCADCIITGCGSMAIRLMYRDAYLKRHPETAGMFIGRVNFDGIAPGNGRIPAPVQ